MSRTVSPDSPIAKRDAASEHSSDMIDTRTDRPRRSRRRLFARLLRSAAETAAEEVFSSWLAEDKNQNSSYVTSRVPKMAVYGALIKHPLNQLLLKTLGYLFRYRTGVLVMLAQILIRFFIIVPIQLHIHAAAIGIIYGVRTADQIRQSYRAVIAPIAKSIGIGVPVAIIFAQNFLPGKAGLAFMKWVSFAVNSSINVGYKKNRETRYRRRRSYDYYSETSDDAHSNDTSHSNDNVQWNGEERSNDDAQSNGAAKPSSDAHSNGEEPLDAPRIDGGKKEENPPVH